MPSFYHYQGLDCCATYDLNRFLLSRTLNGRQKRLTEFRLTGPVKLLQTGACTDRRLDRQYLGPRTITAQGVPRPRPRYAKLHVFFSMRSQ